jgi:type VI secretion system protein ImpE
MLAQESLRAGRLDDALAELQQLVRKEPEKAQHRVFLFQLLVVLGRWERALQQLEAVAQLDPSAMAMVGTYRAAIAAEVVRSHVFAGEVRPQIIGEPEEWMAWLVEALRLTAAGQHAAASELRGRAFDSAPVTSGELDGAPFAWIADGDARLGPMLEVVLNGRYAWLPFQRVTAVRLEAPTDLRDLVWAPAFLTMQTGAEVPALIPSRYPGSADSADGALRLGRRTEWSERGEGTGCWVGLGQRMLATDEGEHPFLEIRNLQLRGDAAPGSKDPAQL